MAELVSQLAPETRQGLFMREALLPAVGLAVACVDRVCRDSSGSELGRLPADAERVALMADASGCAYRASSGELRVASWQGVERVATEEPFQGTAQVIAVSQRELYVVELDGGGNSITRILDGEVLKVASSTRAGGAVVATRTELDACATVNIAGIWITFAGYDSARRALLVRVNHGEDWIEAVTQTGQGRVVLPVELDQAVPIQPLRGSLGEVNVTVGPTGGVTRVDRILSTHNPGAPAVTLVNSAFRPTKTTLSQADQFKPGPWFGEGFFNAAPMSYAILDNGVVAGAVCDHRNNCVPDWPSGSPGHRPLSYEYYNMAQLWVGRSAQPQRGEGILAANPPRQRQRRWSMTPWTPR